MIYEVGNKVVILRNGQEDTVDAVLRDENPDRSAYHLAKSVCWFSSAELGPLTTGYKLWPDKAAENPKTRYGNLKTPLALIPGAALVEEAEAMACGAEKYGAYNWRTTDVPAMTYVSAAMRHLLKYLDGQDIDPESGAHHLAHVRACCGILIDAEAVGGLVDDRPPAGRSAESMELAEKRRAARKT